MAFGARYDSSLKSETRRFRFEGEDDEYAFLLSVIRYITFYFIIYMNI